MKRYCLIAAACAGAVFAQEIAPSPKNDSLRLYQLNEVMISATRSQKSIDAIGRSVEVINKEQIQSFLHQSTGELLSMQPGSFVVGAAQNPGMNQALFLRGTGTHQTAIMIDGVRLTDPSTVNNVADLSELSLLGTDRLEIVRGTHSTLYGSLAVGGVINILSGKNELPGMHIDVSGSTGTLGQRSFLHLENMLLNYSDASGIYVTGGAENYSVRGIDATVDTVTGSSAYKNRDKDGFGKKDYLMKIGYSQEVGDFYISYKKSSQVSDIDRTAFVDDDNYTLEFDRNLIAYGGMYQFHPSIGLKYIGGYSTLRRYAVNDSSVIDVLGTTDHTFFTDEYSGTSLTNEVQTNLSLNGVDAVIGAGQYVETMNVASHFFTWSSFGVYESRTNLDTLNIQSTLTNVFARVDLNGALIAELLKDVSIGVGGRINRHDTYGTNITYEVNPSYQIVDNGLFYLLYATGFTAPSLYQLFAPNTYYTSPITRGNKDLQPEKSSSFEIGYKMSVSDAHHFSLSYFTTSVTNSIEYVYLWDGSVGTDTLGNDWMRDDYRGDTYLNIGEVSTSGFEAAFQSAILPQISLAGNFTYFTGSLSYNPDEINARQTLKHHVQLFNNGAFLNRKVESTTLVRRPVTANFSGVYRPIADLYLRVDCRIVGERFDVHYDPTLGPFGALGSIPVESYTLVDFSPRYIYSDYITMNGRIENIFDRKYSDIRGFTTRGRSFYFGIQLKM